MVSLISTIIENNINVILQRILFAKIKLIIICNKWFNCHKPTIRPPPTYVPFDKRTKDTDND